MGMFSWFTSDQKKRIVNGRPMDVWMTGKDGQVFHETCYQGYGDFEGKDYYAYLAQLNRPDECTGKNSEDRDIGISLAYDDHEPADKVIEFPKLLSKFENVKQQEKFQKPKDDPNQGFPKDKEWGI